MNRPAKQPEIKENLSGNFLVKDGNAVIAGFKKKDHAKLVIHYQMRYPNNKFITEDQVEAICKKYNLICGPVSRYKGFVPDQKLKQIESLNVKKDDLFEGYITFDPKDQRSHRIMDVISEFPNLRIPIKNFKNGDGWVRKFKDEKDWGTLIGRLDNWTEVSMKGMFICAPKKDMDTKGLSKIGALFAAVTQRSIPDPVVLSPVNGGYLVVAAWGDEASDEIVVNQKMN